ncbi:MAG: glycosyltransferase family 4 protein [Sedimentisphaerales bacterium]|nr:glycosyltransferase family 4 protein [Sedimentisphaerales bacterium]
MIRKLIDSDYEVTLVSSDFDNLNKLKEDLNCKIYSTPISRRVSPFRDIISICRLSLFLHKQKFKIVHAHTPKGGFIGMISSRLAFIPNRIYTIHGLVLETARGIKKKLLWFSEWLSCKLATQVLAVSPSLRQRVIDEGICSEEKIQVLGYGSACGINIDKFTRNENYSVMRSSIRSDYNIHEDAIVIGFLGRIVPDKGIETLVLAFKGLQKLDKRCYLLLVGNFETVRDCLDGETIQEINNNPQIICNGEFVSDVLPFYAAMDINVLPSRREGFGLTLIEASALELPVISTKITGCVDAVEDNVTGLLVDVDDVEQLSDAMLKLVNDSELRCTLGKNGRQRARDLFDSRRLVTSHISLYQNCSI